jgi:cytoskeletal protein RodZ
VNTTKAASYSSDDDRSYERTGSILTAAPDVVEVRRNGGLGALLGAAASAVAIGYLARAVATSAPLDWALAVGLGLLAVFHLHSFVDARTPLLVADTQGVRIRLGRAWRGVPWGGLASVEVTPRQGLVRDGRLVLVPRNAEKVLGDLDASGRRQGKISNFLYGSPFALPLGLSTRVSGDSSEDLATALRQLAGGGARVVELLPGSATAAEPVEVVETEERSPSALRRALRLPDPRRFLAHAISGVAGVSGGMKAGAEARAERKSERAAERETARLAEEAAAEEAARIVPASPTPSPLRQARPGKRAEIRANLVSAPDVPEAAAVTGPVEGRELRRLGSVDLVEEKVTWGDRVRPIARIRESVEPLVIDDFAAQPAADPIIGPNLAAARRRIGLSVDQLAERTRIRPHVIEAIEVDDFVPCGGDFYARGHLRTLARVLGVEIAPLMASYDERYADAPINPRRVFEAELASGSHGGIRSMKGGPNWSILVAAVMTVVLAWSIARLVTDSPVEVRSTAPTLQAGPDGSGVPNYIGTQPVTLRLTASDGGARVVVRDDQGDVAFRGSIAADEQQELSVVPPVSVEVKDSGAVAVAISGQSKGFVGGAGGKDLRTFTVAQAGQK